MLLLVCLQPARVALRSGSEGISAINTIMSVMGINLNTLRPEPCVEGFAFNPFLFFFLFETTSFPFSGPPKMKFKFRYSTPGGYSCKAVRPIALAKVMNIARMIKEEFGDRDCSLSGIGGVETGGDAAEFLLLGADTVQV